MLDSVRKHAIALPQVPAQFWLTATTVGSFGWLLLQDQIPPVLVYALQLYLTF